MSYIPRLKNEYKSNVVARLMKEFSYDNVMQVPKLQKIVISKGVGAAVNDKKLIDHDLNEITVGGAELYEPRCWRHHSYFRETGQTVKATDF